MHDLTNKRWPNVRHREGRSKGFAEAVQRPSWAGKAVLAENWEVSGELWAGLEGQDGKWRRKVENIGISGGRSWSIFK